MAYYLSRYPASVESHVHVTKAYLPIDIVKSLSVYPSLVQKAVEAFYTRDAIQLRVRSITIYNLSSHSTLNLNLIFRQRIACLIFLLVHVYWLRSS